MPRFFDAGIQVRCWWIDAEGCKLYLMLYQISQSRSRNTSSHTKHAAAAGSAAAAMLLLFGLLMSPGTATAPQRIAQLLHWVRETYARASNYLCCMTLLAPGSSAQQCVQIT
jgi:hypothetical protein